MFEESSPCQPEWQNIGQRILLLEEPVIFIRQNHDNHRS